MSTNFVALKSGFSFLWILLVLGISTKRVSSSLSVGLTDYKMLEPVNGTNFSTPLPSEQIKLRKVDESFGYCDYDFDCHSHGVCVSSHCYCRLSYKVDGRRCKQIDCKQASDCAEYHAHTECSNDSLCVCVEGYYSNVNGYRCSKDKPYKEILLVVGIIALCIIVPCCIWYCVWNSRNKKAQAGTNSQAPSGSAAAAAASGAVTSGSMQQAGHQNPGGSSLA